MNIKILLVSIGFAITAYLFYYLAKNHTPESVQPHEDDNFTDKAIRFKSRFRLWMLALVTLATSIYLLVKAL